MGQLQGAVRVGPVRQNLTLSLKGHRDPLQQSVESDAERRLLQPVELSVKMHGLLRHFPRLPQDFLHVEMQTVELNPYDGRRAGSLFSCVLRSHGRNVDT